MPVSSRPLHGLDGFDGFDGLNRFDRRAQLLKCLLRFLGFLPNAFLLDSSASALTGGGELGQAHLLWCFGPFHLIDLHTVIYVNINVTVSLAVLDSLSGEVSEGFAPQGCGQGLG